MRIHQQDECSLYEYIESIQATFVLPCLVILLIFFTIRFVPEGVLEA